MKKKKKKLPYFKTAKEEANFWDTHDVTDYLDQFDRVDDLFVLAPSLQKKIMDRAKKRLVSIRLAKWEIENSKKIAKKKRVPYQTLMREWIDEGIRRESRRAA